METTHPLKRILIILGFFLGAEGTSQKKTRKWIYRNLWAFSSTSVLVVGLVIWDDITPTPRWSMVGLSSTLIWEGGPDIHRPGNLGGSRQETQVPQPFFRLTSMIHTYNIYIYINLFIHIVHIYWWVVLRFFFEMEIVEHIATGILSICTGQKKVCCICTVYNTVCMIYVYYLYTFKYTC